MSLAARTRLRQHPTRSAETIAINRQSDLFLSDPQPELLEDRPEHVYRADPDEVRRDPKALAAYLGASDEALNVSGPLAASSTADAGAPDGPPVDGGPGKEG